MKLCQQCGKGNRDDIRHCQACGARLFRPAERACSKCGLSNELGTRYCQSCGTTLLPSVAPDRGGNQDAASRILGVQNADPPQSRPAPPDDPEMPEWVTRFGASPPSRQNDQPPPDDDSTSQLLLLLRRILGVAPDEISSIQIRKKNGQTIDLPTDPPKYAGTRRSSDFRWH